jgi:1,4-alpha-glucan branching enzyme
MIDRSGYPSPVPGFTFVLHSHIPYCRQTGRWPHGEEWIHEAIAETYVPLLVGLHDLAAEGVPFHLTLGVTPVLAEQLADADIQEHFLDYVDERLAAIEADIARFAPGGTEPDGALARLATWYYAEYVAVREAFDLRFGRDLIGAIRVLADAGQVAVATSAATHAYLPLLSTDESVRAQLATGVRAHRRHFGHAPRAIWIPECAYRPGYADERNGQLRIRPGIEDFLAEEGLEVFFVETHAITGGEPVGKAAGEAIGLYGGVPRREVLHAEATIAPGEMTTYHPYWVGRRRVAAVGRDNRTSMQVWSSVIGYPGDPAYREFHRKDPESGLQYWRVTGPNADLGAKGLYDPALARQRVEAHAEHFVEVVHATARDFAAVHGEGLIAANYDTELFGHWWFEGPRWIVAVLRRLAASDEVELTDAVSWIHHHPPDHVALIAEGSWGAGGTHWTWDNPENHWMWRLIDAAEARLRDLAVRHAGASGTRAAVLAQAARELLLLQSSDWPFLVTTGQAAEYATLRFTEHLAKFNRLAYLAEAPEPGDEALAVVGETWEQDKLFADIDLADWRPRASEPDAVASEA